ncbi:hypothetical protein SETIT_3G241000v2 [Setaria italica]|uniref:BED-type domain-containing protein n=1 Tax=Setaria italica TaxID=4555 RepID=A0A368QI97_SETIT|nr:uncharacterized protein LOC111256813 [Setaria italica]RCV17706.1 hypothetical protein SETIT_3G241000v2 [Setaria italica]
MASGDNDFGDNAEPLWRHVDVLEGSGSLDEDNVRFLCDYCNRVFHGNYSAVEAHLLEWSRHGVEDCTGLTDTIHTQLENEYVAAEDSNARTMPMDMPLTHSATSSDSSGRSVTGKAIVQPKRRKKSTDFHEDIRAMFRDLLDAEIARLFYSAGLALDVATNPYYDISFSLARKKDIPGCTDVKNASMESQDHWASQVAMIVYYSGLSFNLAKNPYYHGSLSVATMVHIPGYPPPGPEKLKTTLLK